MSRPRSASVGNPTTTGKISVTKSRLAPPKPVLTLTPGVQLARAVDTALLDLQKVYAAERSEMLGAMRRVNDNLHGALAHTAAIGETCMIAAAVQAVRAAENHLAASELNKATVALTAARGRLPASRDAR